jgi:Fe-S-cluster containining protein
MSKMDTIIENLPAKAEEVKKETLKFFKRVNKKAPKNFDVGMQELHDKEFRKTDCMECANCCKTSSPIFTNKDIDRIAKHFRMPVQKFTDTYLQMDEDDWFVLKSAPCTFLADDNSCTIYDVRPKACAEYPHTNRKRFQKIAPLTMKNVEICPAAFNIVEAMKVKFAEKGGKHNRWDI